MPKKKTPSSTATPHSIKFSREQLENQAWRLNNLYRIRNKTGTIVDFRFNRAQAELYKNLRHRNVILKARQLGMSTFVALYMLDHCLFKAGQSAGTVAHDLPSARGLFRDKIKFAFDNLDDQLRNLREPLTDSSDELVLGNGSQFRVATSMRSATLNLLHVSEFGKISLFHPDRAEEVINGTLPAVERDGMVFFESTAMGQDGYFYQMCAKAQELMRLKRPLSPLQYKFHFFPWYGEPDYVAKVTTPIEPYVQDYFAKLKAEHGIDLPPQRQAWYQLMLETQQENMRREFPSVADEAFSATLEGTIYGHQLQRAEMEQRIKPYIAINRNHALCTAWDIGVDDATSIWIFQHLKQANGDPGPINFLSYYESNNEEASHYVKKIKEICDKNYWGNIRPTISCRMNSNHSTGPLAMCGF